MEAGALPRPPRGLTLRSRRLLGALSDERLVEQIRRGNDAAFEVVYDRHSAAILSFCRHMVGSLEEAEDAVQHTFIAAYNDLLVGDRAIKLRAWLYTIARNRCLSMLRARREQAVEEVEISTAGLVEQVQERQDLRELLADMRELPDDQRAALVLAELGDLPHADIAEVLGVEAAKVKSLVFQARSNLIENRDARAIPCHEIREQLSTLRGGALRRGPLRKHLKACSGCSEFREEVKRQRAMMAAVLPVIPTLGLKHTALAAVGLGGGGGAAAAAGGGAAGAGIVSVLSSAGIATKAAVVLAVGGAAIGGGVAVEQAVTSSTPSSPPSSVEQGTTHRSSVGADHAQGPPAGTPAQPGAAATSSSPGVKRRVRAHGAPITKHHAGAHANNGIGRLLHVPPAKGHANQQSSTDHGNSGTRGGSKSDRSASGGKESHTSAGSQGTTHAPSSTSHSQPPDAGSTSTTPLIPDAAGSSTHGRPPQVPPVTP